MVHDHILDRGAAFRGNDIALRALPPNGGTFQGNGGPFENSLCATLRGTPMFFRLVGLRMPGMPSSLLIPVATSPAFFAALARWSTPCL
jgi:hypothetical protein